MIKIEKLNKLFGKVQVLKGVDLSIDHGKIVAILGPNGSGKTTLIKCLLGLTIPTSGTIFVNGKNIENNWQYRNDIGYLPQIAHFPENLTVKELFSMISDLRKQKADYSELVSYFEMGEFIGKPLRSLSGGTRQKANIILALMFNPSFFIFDEPSSGLDPLSRVRFKDRVEKEKQNGKTVLFTTHLLNEVEELADEIFFLLEGKIYFHGKPQQLKDEQNQPSLEKAIAAMLVKNKNNPATTYSNSEIK
ncbi:MAG TPA: ABC transporter ATP-binding protein [Bacteroidia bacterium]